MYITAVYSKGSLEGFLRKDKKIVAFPEKECYYGSYSQANSEANTLKINPKLEFTTFDLLDFILDNPDLIKKFCQKEGK